VIVRRFGLVCLESLELLVESGGPKDVFFCLFGTRVGFQDCSGRRRTQADSALSADISFYKILLMRTRLNAFHQKETELFLSEEHWSFSTRRRLNFFRQKKIKPVPLKEEWTSFISLLI
jgi:hypothetical protein